MAVFIGNPPLLLFLKIVLPDSGHRTRVVKRHHLNIPFKEKPADSRIHIKAVGRQFEHADVSVDFT